MERSNFIDTLIDTHRGELIEDADKGLADLLQKLAERGGTGSVVLTLKVSHFAEGQVKAEGTVVTKVPKKKLPASIFYKKAGQLTRTNPNQVTINFEDHNAETTND